ncbi:acyl-CoA dehydratase activase [Salidesulfovibrio onnuriiensis]|uniref:acyl-CoA dehydratase activase n=1 Tax=Salidesulfovibrio onnuriiensis TaxID=2583823 RepID=UPI0011CA5AF1|nr:acyl-CoA dehydratase activase [Salidesulfovibrio onnuriiensis]
MFSMGIDIGYSAVKAAVLAPDGEIVHTDYVLHKGNVETAIRETLARIRELPEAAEIRRGAAMGSGGALLDASTGVPLVNEVAALVEGALHLDRHCASIVEMGGQTAKFITGFGPENKTGVKMAATSNCSSGTGSFLEEQVSRLGMDIEDYSAHAARATFIPRIAGRCSVFAKTDITHHQQEGVPTPDILAGLAHAVTRNFRGAVMRRLPKNRPMLFVGGVCRNSAITKAMRTELGLNPGELRVHKHSAVAGAMGAAVIAARDKLAIGLPEVMDTLQTARLRPLPEGGELPPLRGMGSDDAREKHNCAPLPHEGAAPCWLGVDVGSTSTNLVLVDSRNNILAYRYLRTAGDPVRAVRTGLAELKRELGNAVTVAGAATTGSGRYLTGRLIGADVVRDEITAQARAAAAIDPEVDTIFEIGGQDSKFISLKNGVVTDFQMNKICAAGTGSFIEEQAKKLGIPLEEIGPAALAGESPVSLGERCTVFMEAAIAAHLAHGAKTRNLAAGLCHSIVKNYLNRVVGQKPLGRTIFLQGGVAHNQGVVNAFRAATGRPVTVPPFFSVTGAYGAAILAREEMKAGETTAFKGFTPPAPGEPLGQEKDSAPRVSDFNRTVHDFIFAGYDGVLDPSKKTVGIPRALFCFGMFPLFFPFFRELGFNVLLSEPTSEETIRLAQDYSLDETCYPVKLVNGHAAELAAKGVDYLFFPDLYTVFHPSSKARQNYGCAYMQLAFKIINKAMDLENRGIKLLAPTIAFNLGQDFVRNAFMSMGRDLGKNDAETGAALQKAMESFKGFEKRVEKRSREALAGLDPNRKTFVLISKIYGVADPMLNLGIPDKLAEMGHQTLPCYDMPDVDIFQQHPNMYWPFGQHILKAARLVAEHPNLYAVFLTHHGCGPDTATAHYFKEIMGSKPYLTIEVDEHSSGVGVLTRVEAFVNSLGKSKPQPAGPLEAYTDMPPEEPVRIAAEGFGPLQGPVFLPRLYPYAHLACAALQAEGVDARLLEPTTETSMALGRRHTVTNEYYSLAALLGDALATLRGTRGKQTLLLPQNEGAEVDGQYARFLRNKLDLSGLRHVELLSPFLEDLPCRQGPLANTLFLCLLAGDLTLLAPRKNRPEVLERVLERVRRGQLTLEFLTALARDLGASGESGNGSKTVLAVGEPMVLFNDTLNDNTFERLEGLGHRVVYAPLGECLWSFWDDAARQRPEEQGRAIRRRLDRFREQMAILGAALGAASPYEPDPHRLTDAADGTLGHYAGAFGRYRGAKTRCAPQGIDGVLTVSSMYENTGISLGILHQDDPGGLPVLPLTFDGTRNENDRMKVESFLYYL